MDPSDDVAFHHEISNHEPSAWFLTAVGNRLAALVGAGGLPDLFGIVTFNLNDSMAGTREDRTCDRDRVYVPPGSVFVTGLTEIAPHRLPWPWSRALAGRQVLVAYGLCPACAALEVGPLDQLDELPEDDQ